MLRDHRFLGATIQLSSLPLLDQYLPEEIRRIIEQNYYAKVNEGTRLEALINDEVFLADPEHHVATFSDHGIVHARDVALLVLQVLDAVHGIIIPERPAQRLRFMKGYAVMLAYVHDIGMADFSKSGRAMHAEVATQVVFSNEFDAIVTALWDQNVGNVPWRLANLYQRDALAVNPILVLRELLSLAVCHSKSSVPAPLLADRAALRSLMQETASVDLHYQYEQKQLDRARTALDAGTRRSPASGKYHGAYPGRGSTRASTPTTSAHDGIPQNERFSPQIERDYDDFGQQAYAWLLSANPDVRALIEDVIDSIRAVRCADALRQRGTVQKTSAGYEVFVNQETANAICAMRYGRDKLYLLEIVSPLSVGEANIASCELSRDGNLRISFHLGAFFDEEARVTAAYNAAVVINDIQADVIESLGDSAEVMGHQISILLEGTEDDLDFAARVLRTLHDINPDAASRARTVPALQNVAYRERELYLRAEELDWDLEQRQMALRRIAESGHKIEAMDLVESFKDVRLVRLETGETLVESGDPSGFVYIPIVGTCRGIPLGGYKPFTTYPWIPLGVTGVVRGAVRNATLVADEDAELLMIPRGLSQALASHL